MHVPFVRASADVRNGVLSNSVARLEVNGNFIYAQIRGLNSEVKSVRLSEWHRRLLRIPENSAFDISISIEPAGFLGKLRAFSYVPDALQRTVFAVALIGTGLAVGSLALSLMQLDWGVWIADSRWYVWMWGVADLMAIIGLWFAVLWLLVTGFRIMTRDEPEDIN